MKEYEAKMKYCPMIQPADGLRKADYLCTASDCMMWVRKITNRDHRNYGDGDCGLKSKEGVYHE